MSRRLREVVFLIAVVGIAAVDGCVVSGLKFKYALTVIGAAGGTALVLRLIDSMILGARSPRLVRSLLFLAIGVVFVVLACKCDLGQILTSIFIGAGTGSFYLAIDVSRLFYRSTANPQIL